MQAVGTWMFLSMQLWREREREGLPGRCRWAALEPRTSELNIDPGLKPSGVAQHRQEAGAPRLQSGVRPLPAGPPPHPRHTHHNTLAPSHPPHAPQYRRLLRRCDAPSVGSSAVRHRRKGLSAPVGDFYALRAVEIPGKACVLRVFKVL